MKEKIKKVFGLLGALIFLIILWVILFLSVREAWKYETAYKEPCYCKTEAVYPPAIYIPF